MNLFKKFTHNPTFIRLFNWEFWPFHMVNGPLYPIWLLICLRNRSMFFFNASNPTIEYGGMVMESKFKIAEIIPENFHPKTILVKPTDTDESILVKTREKRFQYPLIVKPDIGGRGRGVSRIESEEELLPYLRKFPFDMLIQDLVPYENEVGIFYCRQPDEEKGKVTGIVGKHFLHVIGNGKSTVDELLQADRRSVMYLDRLRASMSHDELGQVLPSGEKKVLVPYGNHARGALFLDYHDWIDNELTESFDRISRQIPGYYFGRMDIRFKDRESLRKGEDFYIIELNGAGSEPTHMYDPKHSVFFAWKEIVKHWMLLSRVSRKNHTIHKVPYMTFKEGVKLFRENSEYDKVLESIA